MPPTKFIVRSELENPVFVQAFMQMNGSLNFDDRVYTSDYLDNLDKDSVVYWLHGVVKVYARGEDLLVAAGRLHPIKARR